MQSSEEFQYKEKIEMVKLQQVLKIYQEFKLLNNERMMKIRFLKINLRKDSNLVTIIL